MLGSGILGTSICDFMSIRCWWIVGSVACVLVALGGWTFHCLDTYECMSPTDSPLLKVVGEPCGEVSLLSAEPEDKSLAQARGIEPLLTRPRRFTILVERLYANKLSPHVRSYGVTYVIQSGRVVEQSSQSKEERSWSSNGLD